MLFVIGPLLIFFFLWLEFTFSQKIDHLLYKNKTKTVYATAVRSLSI